MNLRQKEELIYAISAHMAENSSLRELVGMYQYGYPNPVCDWKKSEMIRYINSNPDTMKRIPVDIVEDLSLG